jgi:hypothetical protein
MELTRKNFKITFSLKQFIYVINNVVNQDYLSVLEISLTGKKYLSTMKKSFTLYLTVFNR